MIIVTGASRGLGRAICERLLDGGHEVLGLARHVERCSFPAMACDVSEAGPVKEIARKLRARRDQVVALINAAGVASMNLALTTPPATAARIISTNLLGTIYCCQSIAPLMVRRRSGSIINFSTIAVALGLAGESVYAASKAGVEAFSRSFAREMAPFEIRVNCIAPGPIMTDLIAGVPEEKIDEIVRRQVISKRFGPEAVCDLVELLLDPRSASLSGQVLRVGGA